MKLTKIVLGLLLVLSMGLHAEEETVDVNFRNLSVKDFIEMVSKITHKNILIEEEPKGTINFVSTTPIKKSSLFALANSILGGKGLALIDQGEYYKVVKSVDAAGEGLDVSSAINGDTMKTVMFPLKNSNAAVLRAKIQPLLHKNAKIISFKENNILAITANPQALRAIAKVITAVEKTGEKKSVVVKLKNSLAKDVFPNVQNMSKKIFPQTIESEVVDVFQDEATNSIILVGISANNSRMIRYIKQLDTKGESTTQKMYVLDLKNSNVEEMEIIMSKLISQLNDVEVKAPVKGGKPPSKALVVSDIERNALVVLATAEQMKNIRETVMRIDVPKVQVYVKARIVEIDTNLAAQIGINYGLEGGAITSTGLFTGAGNLGAQSLQISPALLGFLNTNQTTVQTDPVTGQLVQQTDPAFKFEDTDKVFALGAKLDLLQQNGAAHLLSEPSVLCTNNKEAEIYVGQTMSILTAAQQAPTGLAPVVNNYSREDIGLTLKVKPRLSSNNKVSMEIETVLEDLDPSSEQLADRPTTTKRTVKTSVVVNNGELVVLGGLIKKSGGKGVTSIPVLGDIPVLGELLFTHNSDVKREQNVVIYLTPYIVRRSDDLQKLKEMLSELEEVQGRYNAFYSKELEKQKKPFYSTTSSTPASNRINRATSDTNF